MPENEADVKDLVADTEGMEYSHATCQEVHPMGSVKKGDVFKALCGVNSICMGYRPEMPHCPKCMDFFKKFHIGEIECPLCDKKFKDHVK